MNPENPQFRKPTEAETIAKMYLDVNGGNCPEGHDPHDLSKQPEGGCNKCVGMNQLHHLAGNHSDSVYLDTCPECRKELYK
jgi:hypothetical protein